MKKYLNLLFLFVLCYALAMSSFAATFVEPYIPPGAEVQKTPRTIYGPDDAIIITNGNVYPARAIAQLRVKYPNLTSYRYGTGFMYGTYTMATARHTIKDNRYGGYATNITAYFGRTASGTFKTANVSSMRIPTGYDGSAATWQYDYGALKFSTPIGNETGNLGMSDNFRVGMSVKVQGYRTNGNTVYYDQYQSPGSILASSDYSLVFRNDTLPGTSGAPVFDANNYAYAIFNYNDNEGNYISDSNTKPTNYNFGARLTPSVIQWFTSY